MRVVTEIYDFITGGSIASPIVLALAIVCAFALPAGIRLWTFIACCAFALVAASFEKPS